MNTYLVRFYEPRYGARVGVLLEDVVSDVTPIFGTFGAWLESTVGQVEAAIGDLAIVAERATSKYPRSRFENLPTADQPHWLPPCDTQEIWAAGVTYERSRDARQEEAVDGGDVYARVYRAKRPELFFKALASRAVGPLGNVGIRRDATWNVPEPELTLVLNSALEVVGVTAGNDMSSRDIEGENPLYLPQAKIYSASCAIGPAIQLGAWQQWPAVGIGVTVEREGKIVVSEQTHTERLHRQLPELVGYLGHSNTYPDGALLMTGTGIVPPANFTLAAGDRITVAIDGIGSLINSVVVV